jgi:Spy/CpxP family protein refolding chaperone
MGGVGVSKIDRGTVEKEKHNMKTKFSSLAVALLALMLCGTAVISSAQQNDESGAPAWAGHRHARMERMAQALNLTDAQKVQIKTIMQSQRSTVRPLMLQLEQNRAAMLSATASGAFDQAKVQQLAAQRAQIMAQLSVQKAQIHSQIYNQVLTSDQKTKADQMRQTRLDRINQRVQKLEAAPQPSAQ